MKKINKLTAAQQALLPIYRDKWLAVGLSCEPMDFEKAKAAAIKCYENAGLTPPNRFIRAGGPVSGAIIASILAKGAGNSVRNSVRNSVWESVGKSVRESVGKSARGSARDSVWDMVYGAHDAHWLGFYDYMQSVLGLSACEKLGGLADLARVCGWWSPYRNVVILQDRHNILRRDDQGRIHCPDAPAIAYPDGYKIYAIHGVQVPQWIIEQPQYITPAKIEAETNSEIRRVMIEIMGIKNYVAQSVFTVIDEADENHPVAGLRKARLLQKQIDTHEHPLTVVECINSSPEPDGTFRTYHLSVNPSHYNGEAGRNVWAAMASTWRPKGRRDELFFKDWREYQPIIET